MMKKFFIVMFAMMIFTMFENISHAATPTYPLANITVYQLFANMGYNNIDTSRPGMRTPDGYPIYGTNLPESPLAQSKEFANIIAISDKSGSKILGVKLFFNRTREVDGTVAVISKVIKALDDNIYQNMSKSWVDAQITEFLTSTTFDTYDKNISLKSMDYKYSLSRKYTNGGLILQVTIEAVRK